MDAINMIFENYGNERLGRIFKNYWMLLLLIKQLVFSFFIVEPPKNEIIPIQKTEIAEQACEDREKTFSLSLLPQLLATVNQLNSNLQIDKPNLN